MSSAHDAERLTSRRLLAKLIDLAVCLALVHVVWYPCWSYVIRSDSSEGLDGLAALVLILFASLFLVILCLIVPIIYDVMCIAGWGRTLGKHIAGIEVVRHDSGRRLGLFRVMGRGLLPGLVGVSVFVAIWVTAPMFRVEVRQLMPIDRFDEVLEEAVDRSIEFLGIAFSDTASMWHAFPQRLVVMLSLMVLPLVGYMPVLWSRSGRAWYDRMIGAMVVKARQTSDHPASPRGGDVVSESSSAANGDRSVHDDESPAGSGHGLMSRLLLAGFMSLVVCLLLVEGVWFLIRLIH